MLHVFPALLLYPCVFLWLEQELTAVNFFVPWNYTKKERKGERELTLTAVSTETADKKSFK